MVLTKRACAIRGKFARLKETLKLAHRWIKPLSLKSVVTPKVGMVTLRLGEP